MRNGFYASTHPAYIGNGYYRCSCGVEEKGMENFLRHSYGCTKITQQELCDQLSAKQWRNYLKGDKNGR